MAQGLRRCTSTEVDMGSIPGQGTQISHAVWPKSKYFKNKLIQVKMENKIRNMDGEVTECQTKVRFSSIGKSSCWEMLSLFKI